MRRPFLLIPLLAFGTVAGFASGFHSLHHRGGCHGWGDDNWRRDAELEQFAPAPVVVQAPAPAPVAAPPPPAAPAQTLVIPIIVGAGTAAPVQPTTYLIQLPGNGAAPAAAPVVVPVPATTPAPQPAAR